MGHLSGEPQGESGRPADCDGLTGTLHVERPVLRGAGSLPSLHPRPLPSQGLRGHSVPTTTMDTECPGVPTERKRGGTGVGQRRGLPPRATHSSTQHNWESPGEEDSDAGPARGPQLITCSTLMS